MVVCLSMVDWRPVLGVPRLSPYGTWDGLHPSHDAELDKQKEMDGCFMSVSYIISDFTFIDSK